VFGNQKIFAFVRKLLYVVLPVILLYVIFRKIDFPQLLEYLQNVNVWLVLAGISLRPMQIILGSVRWRTLNAFFCQSSLPVSTMIHHYWSGLAIGYFTPGNLGWDAYRVVVVGKKLKTYSGAFFTIVAEKFIGLISVITTLLLVFPFVAGKMTRNADATQKLYLVALLSLVIAIVVLRFFVRKERKRGFRKIKTFFEKILRKFLNSIKNPGIRNEIKKDFSKSNRFISIAKEPKTFFFTFILSLGILATAAICSQLIFMGLDHPISFLVNLFAAPVFFILFLIPISFGSVGIREGAFILLYGQFGVPMEIALLVSFFNLFGLLLNNIVGALFILKKGVKSIRATDMPDD